MAALVRNTETQVWLLMCVTVVSGTVTSSSYHCQALALGLSSPTLQAGRPWGAHGRRQALALLAAATGTAICSPQDLQETGLAIRKLQVWYAAPCTARQCFVLS